MDRCDRRPDATHLIAPGALAIWSPRPDTPGIPRPSVTVDDAGKGAGASSRSGTGRHAARRPGRLRRMPPSIAEVHAALTAPGQMFEMEEVEIRGIPTRTWKLAPRSLRWVVEQSLPNGGLPFLVYEDESLTFAEHFAAVATLAHRLVDDLGLRKGDRVAIAMRNFPARSIAFWAAAPAGAVG